MMDKMKKLKVFIESKKTKARLTVYESRANSYTAKAMEMRDYLRDQFPELIVDAELVEE